jgi:hypothetical protein
MKFYSCIPVALAVAANLSCGTSHPNADRAELATASSEALMPDDGGTGKGVVTLDLTGFTVVDCAADALASGSSQDGDASSSTGAIATLASTLKGSIVLHVGVQQRGNGNGNGAISSVTLDVASDVSGITDMGVDGFALAVVAFPFAAPNTQVTAATGWQGSAASVMETTVHGANIQSFQSNFTITGMVESRGAGAATAESNEAGAVVSTLALAQAMLFMNVEVTVSRNQGQSSLIVARVTSITSSCVPTAGAAAAGNQTAFSCTNTCTTSGADGGFSCINTCP